MPTFATAKIAHRGVTASLLVAGLLAAACDREAPTAARTLTPSAASSSVSAEKAGTPRRDALGAVDLVARWDAAWAAGDAAGIAALFTEDAEFVNGRGQVAVGTAAIAAQHAGLFAGPFKGSRLRSTVRRVTVLTGTVAVIDVDTELTGFSALPPGTPVTSPGVQRGRHKRVVVKRRGEWRMQLMQITTVAAVP
jgi:uncharacterized protein (TIGR02246 family)